MILQAFFGETQTGLGFQFFNSSGSLIGSRVTAGIVSLPETGGYLVDVVLPGAAVGIFWDSTETPAGVSEDLREALREGAPTVEEIAEAVWDEAIADHVAAGSTGEQLSAAGSGGDPWLTVVPGAYADGTAGAALGRLNNTPAENPVALLPAPPANPDLALLVIDVESLIGSAVTDLQIVVALSSDLPEKTDAGRVIVDRDQTMIHSESEPGRYSLTVEKGSEYHLRNRELFGAAGLRVTPTEDVINLNSLIE